MKVTKKILQSKKFIQQHIKIQPDIGIILGSGLSNVADDVVDAVKIPYSDIPHFVKSTVEGHKGEFVVGSLYSRNIAIMVGRIHFYEGYTMQEITYPIRVMAKLGIKILILTSAVGGINPTYMSGDIVFITDHINFMGDNPLRGEHEIEFGERFPDMSEVYNKELIKKATNATKKCNVQFHKGVYIAVRGPSYETPQEISAFRKLGADVVGMSVVPEAIVAHQMGLKVLCIAFVSNIAAGVNRKKLSHKEVLETASSVSLKLKKIFSVLLKIL